VAVKKDTVPITAGYHDSLVTSVPSGEKKPFKVRINHDLVMRFATHGISGRKTALTPINYPN
jgi:hypothetical protein